MPNITTQFAGTDGATRANFNQRIDDVNAHGNDRFSHNTLLGCTKPSTVYLLTGTLATSNLMPCLFTAPAAYAAGDTFTVNGTAYAVQTSSGSLPAGAFTSGVTISVTLDVTNKKIIFQKLAYTAAEVGLGNVNNTADSAKSVNYANTAGSAPASGGNSATVGGYSPSAFLLVANSAPVKIQSTAPSDGTALWAW